jgi:hypothetical protein
MVKAICKLLILHPYSMEKEVTIDINMNSSYGDVNVKIYIFCDFVFYCSFHLGTKKNGIKIGGRKNQRGL